VTQKQNETQMRQQIESLSQQLKTASEIYQKIFSILEVEKQTHASLQTKYDLLHARMSSANKELKKINNSYVKLNATLKDKNVEIVRLTSEKAICESECKSLRLELKSLQLNKDKITLKLEEQEKTSADITEQ